MPSLQLLQSDLKFALRLVRRAPLFYATLWAVLVAGIGSTTAMFSIAESVLLRPLPYPHSEELTVLVATTAAAPRPDYPSVSLPDFRDWRAQASSFSQMAAVDHHGYSLASSGATPENLAGTGVAGDFFPMFGLPPLRGRLLGPADDHAGAPPVAVVSAALWHRRFASDPELIGRAITLNGRPFTVVGIAAEGFGFSSVTANHVDVWTPLATVYEGYSNESAKERANRSLEVMGRRKPGVTLEQAESQLAAIAKGLETAYPSTNARVGAAAFDMHEMLVESARSGVWTLLGAVVLVFFIVCANVANLLFVRAQTRRGEMATRAALGADPGRLAAQVVTEVLTVFILGSIGGALASFELVDFFASGLYTDFSTAVPVRVDGLALAASLAVCLVCGMLAALVPAYALSRVEPQAVLKESASRAGVSRAQQSIRGGLTVAQVAVAFALLVGGGLALAAFARVSATPPGFDPRNLNEGFVDLASPKYDDVDRVRTFYRDVLARLAAQPGVSSTALNATLPIGGGHDDEPLAIEGRPAWPAGEAPTVGRNVVTPGYLKTMAIPLLEGRDFSEADVAEGRPVALISRTLAERFFRGESPIGRRIDVGGEKPEWREIVGVVGDVRRSGLGKPVVPEAYAPFAQSPSRRMSIVVRSSRPTAMLEELPVVVQAVDPEQAVWRGRLMEERVAKSIAGRRHVAALFGAFAIASLAIATLGIFGLVSYATSQRTRELGIRMALGATPQGLVALVVKGGASLVGLGLAVGLVAAVLLARTMASEVGGVDPFDLRVYAVIAAVLSGAGLLACLVPALRAARIAPATALRYD